MSKKIWLRASLSLALLVSLAFIVFASTSNARVGSSPDISAPPANSDAAGQAVAPQEMTGEWTATLVKDDSKINVNFELHPEKGGRHQMGQTYEFGEFQGLSRDQVLSGGPARFSLVREAGRIDCEGSFQNSKGSGTFRFTGSQTFVSAMKSRGFDFEADSLSKGERSLEDRLFTATALNLRESLPVVSFTPWL